MCMIGSGEDAGGVSWCIPQCDVSFMLQLLEEFPETIKKYDRWGRYVIDDQSQTQTHTRPFQKWLPKLSYYSR